MTTKHNVPGESGLRPLSTDYPRPMASFLAMAKAVAPADCQPSTIDEVGNTLVLAWRDMPSGEVASSRVYDLAWWLYADLKAAAITAVYCPARTILEIVFDPALLEGGRHTVD